MIPEADAMLNAAAGKMLTDIAPAMMPGYSQGSASTLAMVMILAAQEYGRAAEVRQWENGEMRTLLAKGGVALPKPDGALSIAALNVENAMLTKQLIALHERVERDADPLERDILAYLKESAAKRRLYLPVL